MKPYSDKTVKIVEDLNIVNYEFFKKSNQLVGELSLKSIPVCGILHTEWKLENLQWELGQKGIMRKL